ncbi:transporter substrate-binding domain-containing protein [Pantoea cypripedii]|uniref:Amino acid ABC transporter substrate-binding protein n=1 Tax=Pantoea cypripedii TaxID=55209 RepID=A0A6B9GFQ1_PANCY|nr:transporter substrate-binding domain-containing protein [Pantoea cypripedii]QGY33157.1 amino acid ABC transporter substrate-binding protein [Pantoea cypripedii]
MNRHIAYLFCFAAIVTSGYAAAGQTLDRVMKTGVLHNVVVNDYPPFGFIDDNNKLAGFDVDVADAVAKKIGVKLQVTAPGWETIVGGNWAGRWDVCICSMTPNTDRAKLVDFPVSYYNSPAVLIVNNKETQIKSAADLNGKKVGVGTGSSYEQYLQKKLVIPGKPPIHYPFNDVVIIPSDETVAFQNLMLGPGVRLDAIVSDLATAKARIAKTDKLRIVSEVYSEPNWVATDKGDPEFDTLIRNTVNALRTDGTLKTISEKWFGEDITREETP